MEAGLRFFRSRHGVRVRVPQRWQEPSHCRHHQHRGRGGRHRDRAGSDDGPGGGRTRAATSRSAWWLPPSSSCPPRSAVGVDSARTAA